VVKAADRLQNESSSSSNDDDGAMRRGKCKNREKKKTEGSLLHVFYFAYLSTNIILLCILNIDLINSYFRC